MTVEPRAAREYSAEAGAGSSARTVVRVFRAACALCAVGVLLTGCSTPEIQTEYGKRKGVDAGPSVNGTAVLSEFFSQAGYRVVSSRRLSSRLDHADVVVWVPDTFDPPTLAEVTYLERWLEQEDDRTLVYVGRDYDASVEYWSRMLRGAAPEDSLEIRRRLADSESELDNRRLGGPTEYIGRWFSLKRDAPRRKVRSLDGPWSRGIDASKVDIELATRYRITNVVDVSRRNMARDNLPPAPAAGGGIVPPVMAPPTKANPLTRDDQDPDLFVEDSEQWDALTGLEEKLLHSVDFDEYLEGESLLESEGDVLVSRLTLPDSSRSRGSQILVISNGSFLLNLPLLNHEHRKLAGHLVRQCDRDGGRVVFLESGDEGLVIADDTERTTNPTLKMFTTPPLCIILWHLVALGFVHLFAVYPIFGRPRELDPEATSDFGKHVRALGEMLERTGDVQYARGRLSHYHENVLHDHDSSPATTTPGSGDADDSKSERESTSGSESPGAEHQQQEGRVHGT